MTAILLLLCGSWFDVDDVVEPVTPPPALTCSCGCGKADCKCGYYGCKPTATPAVKPSVEAVAKRVVVIYSPAWCGACHAWRIALKREGHEYGDGDILIEWKEAEYPLIERVPDQDRFYPFVMSGGGRQYLQRRRDRQQWSFSDLRKFAGVE